MSNAPDISEYSSEEIREILNEVRNPFEVAVYSSENYFNCGSIIRTSHAFLCKKIWMVDFDKFYRKAAMGAHRWENIEKTSMEEFLKKTVNRNMVVFERRADLDAVDLRTFAYPENPIFFFGSEKFGVPTGILERANSIVSIPMWGIHNDLNLAVSVGIVLYDFMYKEYQRQTT